MSDRATRCRVLDLELVVAGFGTSRQSQGQELPSNAQSRVSNLRNLLALQIRAQHLWGELSTRR